MALIFVIDVMALITYELRDARLPYIYGWPEWKPIRSDPRYGALLKKIGLPTE